MQGYDELPARKGSSNYLPLVLVLVATALGGYLWGRPPANSPLARDVSVHGIHLGDDFDQVVKLRGKPGADQTSPDGSSRIISYPEGDLVVLVKGKVQDIELHNSGSVQFSKSEVKVGDTRQSVEKMLGVADPKISPGLSQVVWPGADYRFAAQFKDGKAVTLKLYR